MKNVLIIIALFLGLNSFAQNAVAPEKPVKWSTYIKDVDGEPNLFIKATVEKGWHYFANIPGGDGLAIPTNIVVSYMDNDQSMEFPVSDAQADNQPKEHNMEGMGKVKYFESDVIYSFPISSLKTRMFTVSIEYQCCNDKMCLPPTSEMLEVRGQ
jgi:hypothetical protein